MSEKIKVAIFDDERDYQTEYGERLKQMNAWDEKYEILNLPDNNEFKSFVDELVRRREEMSDETKEDWNLLMDKADIFIVDYDLLKTRENGENIAYLLRCFSKCKYIIALNQYRAGGFDMTLRGNLESFADLNIDSSFLDNPGLWFGPSSEDCFRPWHWPNLKEYIPSLKKRFDEIGAMFDKGITPSLNDYFSIPEMDLAAIPLNTIELITESREKLGTMTFQDIYKTAPIMARGKDRDRVVSNPAKSRIVVSRLSKWFEREIVAGQNVLVDLPHLVSRYPSLILGDRSEISDWNKTALISKIGDYVRLEKTNMHVFKRNDWLIHPCFVWSSISKDPEIPEVKSPWNQEEQGYAFAEDASRFYQKEDCNEFQSNLESPFLNRYVKVFENVYYPRDRLYS